MKNARLLYMAALAILLGIVGCKGSSNTTAAASAPSASSSTPNSPSSTSSSATSTSTGSAPAPPTNSASLPDFGAPKPVELVDPMYNMVAETMSIPSSWQFEGTILHGPGCGLPYYSEAFRASSSDLRYGLQSTPDVQWAWADDQSARPQGASCKYAPPMTAAEYGAIIAPRMRPNSVVDSVEEAPIAQSLKAFAEQSNQRYRQQAASMRSQYYATMTADAQRFLIHYDLNGQPEEEWIVVEMYVTKMPKPVMASRPGQTLNTAVVPVYMTDVNVFAMRAPKGQLQATVPVFAAINASKKTNNQYQSMLSARSVAFNNQLIAQSWQTTHSILQAGAQAGAQLQANAQAFIQNLQQQGEARNANFNAQMLQKSAHAQDVSDYLLDQQLYVNPTTGQTTTQGNQYNRTLSNGNGAVLQTNSPTFNPNGMLAGNWVELQPIHH